MKDFLRSLVWWLPAIALALAVGWTIEWYRRRDARALAEELGGSFLPGGLVASAQIPEAAAFDGPSASYNNVIRVERPEGTIVVGTYYNSWKGIKGEHKSTSYGVAFVTLPWDAPALDVASRSLRATPELEVPDATDAFKAAFMAEGKGSPEDLRRLLPRAAQEELLAHPTIVCGLQARGRVARIQGVGQLTGGTPRRELYEIARRLAAAWR